MRIKVKQIMAATLITASMLMMGGCDVASTPVAPAPSVGVTDEFTKPWEHSKVFLSDVGDTYKYKNSNYEEIYAETLKELTKVDGKFEEYFGNQVYTTKDGVEVIISGTDLVNIDTTIGTGVHREKTGEKIYRFGSIEAYGEARQIMREIDRIIKGDFITIDSEEFNIVFDYKKMVTQRIIHDAPDGKVAIDIIEVAALSGFDLEIDEENKTFKLSTGKLETTSKTFEHAYSDKAFEKMENSVGDMYYKPWFKEGKYLLVTLEQLQAHTGWDIIYYKDNNLVIFRTDDIYDMIDENIVIEFDSEVIKNADGKEILVEKKPNGVLMDEQGNIVTDPSVTTPPSSSTNSSGGSTVEQPSSGTGTTTPTDPVKPPVKDPVTPPKKDPVYGKDIYDSIPSYPKPNDGKTYDWWMGEGWVAGGPAVTPDFDLTGKITGSPTKPASPNFG